jgi:hypothetical protein
VAGEDVIMFGQRELKRLHVIRKVLEKVIKRVEAAKILSLSYRQVQRCVQRVKGEGDRGIVHKSRGRVSNRRLADKVKERVIKVYRKRYQGFGPTLALEKLWEREGLEVSDETLRQWLLESGDWKRVRKRWGTGSGGSARSIWGRWCRWMVRIMIGLRVEGPSVF